MNQDFKFCPKCGTERQDNQKFCPNCGYSYENPQPEKQPGKIKETFKKAITWCKSHLKIVIPVALALVLVIVLSISIPACVAGQTNGTYYKLNHNGELDKKTYFILKSGKWTDEDGENGTYKKDGDKIVFYYTLFCETDELCDGTLKDKVLIVNGDTYVSEKHKHKYGEWEILSEATCTTDGLNIRSCTCGVSERQEIAKLPHTLTWAFDDDNHWQICSVCNKKSETSKHNNKDSCTVCGYPVEYTLSDDGTYFTVTKSGTSSKSVTILSSINGIPVTSIGNRAFSYCSSLTNVTIGNSVTSIGEGAFSYCSSLTIITIPDSVTSIGNYAFSGCSSLTSITVDKNNTVYKSENNCILSKDGKTLILGCKTSIIPDSVTSIGGDAFGGCSSLTSITIPDRESISDLHPTISY